jgi:hypothetical protein
MMPMTEAILFGLARGTGHAFEADHLAAVTVLNADSRGARQGFVLGAIWGLGHSVALLAVGTVVALTAAALPQGVADAFESCVALMLVLLGTNAIVRAVRDAKLGPSRPHQHAGLAHVHTGPTEHVHLGRWTLAVRPLIVGMIHGLAGSGALSALAVAMWPGTTSRLTYIALFGVGSLLSMAAVSGLAGWPLARFAQKPSAARFVRGAAGLLSTGYGLYWGWPLVERLFG